MKKTLLAIIATAALLMGIGAPAANAYTYSPIPVDTMWSAWQYFPTDKTVTLNVTHPKIEQVTFRIFGDSIDDTKPVPSLKVKPLKGKKGNITGYSYTFPNPKTTKTEYLVTVKTKDATNPTYRTTTVPYMNSTPYIQAKTTISGVAENETRSIQVRLTNPDPRMHYTVQIKDKNTWKNVKTHKNSKIIGADYATDHVKIKFPNKAGKYKYRILATGAYSKKTAKTDAFTITVMKQKKYASYIKKAKTYAKPYCPKTSIYVANGPFAMGKGYAGMAYPGDMAYAIKLGLTGETLKMVSLHECAHILQFSIKQYAPEKTANSYAKTGAKVYKNKQYDWMEIEATCMSLIMSKVKSRASEPYTKTCTTKQFKQAKKTLKNGMKYYKQYRK